MAMTKEEEKIVAEIVAKHKSSVSALVAVYGFTTIVGTIAGLAADLIFTAGFGTVLAIGSGSLTSLTALTHLQAKFGKTTMLSGQVLSGKTDVGLTVSGIEYGLSKSFEKALAKDATLAQAEEFIQKIGIAEADIKSLSPAFKIVADKKRKYGTDKVQLMMRIKEEKEWEDDPATYIIHTLEQAREMITEKIGALKSPPPAEEPPAAKIVKSAPKRLILD